MYNIANCPMRRGHTNNMHIYIYIDHMQLTSIMVSPRVIARAVCPGR